MSRRILIEFIGQDRGLSSSINDADNKTSRLGGTLARVGKMAALGLAGGAVVAGKALVGMTKSAIEDQAAQEALARTLKNTTGATDEQVGKVEDWISAQGKALGVTDDELRPALQRLAEATGDVGEAQKLASLAMDVSAGTGKSLKTVSEALMKAQNGQVAGLSRLGIETKNAAGETLTFEQATAKMADTFGGQAAAKADTLQGKMARLKLIFDEAKETIGAKLIPVVTDLVDWFMTRAMPAIENLGGTFRRVFGGLSGEVGGPLRDVMDIVRGTVSIVRSLWARFGDIILDYTRGAWQSIRTTIGGALKVIAGVVKLFAALLKGDWRGAWDAVKQIVRGALELVKGIVSGSLNTIKAVMRAGWAAVKGIVGGVWDGIKTLIRNGADAVVDFVRSIPDRLRSLGGRFADAGRAIIGAFVDGLKNAAGIVSGIAGNVWDALKGLLNGAIARINSALEFRISVAGKGFTINPPDIQPLARGGIVRARPGGTLALIGEAGHDEAVVPLSGPYAPRGGGMGGDTTIVLQVDGKVLWQALLRQRRLFGKGLGLG